MDAESLPTFATSATTAKLDEALAKAQANIHNAAKDKDNPAFRGSKYADLASIWDACREALGTNGIAVSQWVLHSDDNRLHIVTRVAHCGEWIQARFSLPVGKCDAQGYGSAVTYARRYALAAAVGVAPDDDDDGNAASAGVENKKPGKKPQSKAPDIAPPKRDEKVEAARSAMVELSKRVLATATELGWKRDIATIAAQALGKPWDQAKDRGPRYTAEEYEAIRRDLVVELELLEAEVKMRETADAAMGGVEGAAE
jgi:hypothetical protein